MNRLFPVMFVLSLFMGLTDIKAQNGDIQLPKPDLNEQSCSVVQALATRHSTREFGAQKLTTQQLSNLCWAACGCTRGLNFRTAPTAMNRQEVRLFVFTQDAAYEYLAKTNVLQKKAEGDHRDILAGSQEFVKTAPVVLVMVADFDIYGKKDEMSHLMCSVDVGNVSENINLYCQSVGLVTVPRATMDIQAVRKLLSLTENQLPLMNNPVGFPK